MEIKRDILWRVYLCFIGIGILCFLVLGKAFYIQNFQGIYWKKLSDSVHQRWSELDADRGTIYSDDENMLSTSIPYFDIYIDFEADGLREKNGKRFKDNVDSLAICLAGLFRDQSAATYRKELLRGYKTDDRYFALQQNISFEQYKVLRNFPLVRLGRNRSGFIVRTNYKRLNPFGLLANRTIGLARENSQNVGLERTYDTALKGQNGKQLVRYIAAGNYVPVEGYEIEPENGKDVVTNIDVDIQDLAENALSKGMSENEAEQGTCVVMEASTGKIKAIANLSRQRNGSYWEDYNYALRATEPGSTIKMVTLLSVLSEGHTTLNDEVNVGSEGREFVGVRMVNDAERQPKPIETVKECFAHSSNVGMSKLAYQSFGSQPRHFIQYLHKFHLDAKTGVDLMGEESPVLPKIKGNEGLHAMITMSFGYAIEVTPLQTLMLYNAIANDGKMMKPYLVSRIQSNGVTLKIIQPQVLEERVADSRIIKDAQECMLAVTKIGTGKKAFETALYDAGGKTGTAHVAGRTSTGAKIKYDDGIYQASFVGYFPFAHPKYSCIVVIRTKAHPAKHMGGEVAAPVFREVADKLFARDNPHAESEGVPELKKDSSQFYYAGETRDIKKVLGEFELVYSDSSASNSWSRLYTASHQVVLKKQPIAGKMVPDVRGLGLKDALYLLEGMEIKVNTRGKGKVKTQSIQPGAALTKNQNITLELN
ncbi:MAG TPA: penicillin-binding protein [Puia sp.]|nr:penicillin-binding protein [Puia sp.]